MPVVYHTLDVFTDRIFGGNPLAVFPDARAVPEALLGRIARELNLSETVFVYPPDTAEGTRRIRIFTPGAEVPFAGHPTVGTAWFLVASGAVDGSAKHGDGGRVTLVLEEKVGPVSVEVALEDGRPVSARLTTAVAHREWPLDAPPETVAAMVSLDPDDVGIPRGLPGVGGNGADGLGATEALTPAFASAGLPYVVVPVRSVEAAGRARLDVAARRDALGADPPARFVYVVAPGGAPGVDLHVRMFAPDVGVPEDPATGSACAALGGYLGTRLRARSGDAAWRVEQGVEMGRPSILELDVRVEHGRPARVRVGGSCVSVARCEMEL